MKFIINNAKEKGLEKSIYTARWTLSNLQKP